MRFKVILLTERTEGLFVGSGLLSQCVGICGQATAYFFLCSENTVRKRQWGQDGCREGIANQWMIRFHRFCFSASSTEQLLYRPK